MLCPMPPRASYRDLLRDLLGRPVTVRPGPDQVLDGAATSHLAGYRLDEGEAAALVVVDQSLAIGMGAALGMVPISEARAEVEQGGGRLEGDLLEFLHEVVNIGAKLFNSPGTPHVLLRELVAVPGDVPKDLADLATTPTVREDWLVTIEDHGEGLVTLLG